MYLVLKNILNFIRKQLITTLAYILCLMGCMYQMSKISDLYFSYNTTTNVVFVPMTDHTVDPAFTICVDKSEIKGWRHNMTIEQQFKLFQIPFGFCHIIMQRNKNI